ncbi:MAG TPA: PAS domain-containing protein [Patescibacteria group bacterium]|nr:PAS domain-containing protein [Patescibacteria group bacterium]
MQKLMHWFGGHLGSLMAAGSSSGPGGGTLDGEAQLKAKLRTTFVGLGYTCAVGMVDLLAARGMNFDFFYLLGCAFVGWAAGARSAALVTLASGAFLYLEGAAPSNANMPGWVVHWNLIIRLMGFGAVGWLAAEVGRLTRSLERTVQDKTGRLQSEMEEHKETAVRLRETLELFRQVTENITEVFWVTDPAKTRVNYVSRGFERVWGQPRQAVYTNPATWLEGVHEQDRPRVVHATYTQQITGDYDEEYRVRRPDGTLCWVHDRAFPVRNEKGEVYRIVGITEDVTEHKRAEHLLEAQRDIGVALSVTNDLNAALDQLLETATNLEGIDCGGVYLVNQETGALELQAHSGLSAEFVQKVARYEPDAPEVCLVREGKVRYPICSSDGNTEGCFWSGDGLRSLAVIPMRHEGEILGALNLASHVQDEIPLPIGVALETIAAQAAGAIARIRLERQILEISDREQARIGQDIHDGLCQQLIGMAFNANSLEQTLGAQQRAEVATARRICLLLDEAITEARRVCRGLYPVRLKTEGLVPALEELAHTVTERYNLRCECHLGTRRLLCDITTATHLYRIAQEAINNAVKHSGANNIHLQLEASEGSLELQVKDDGTGLKTNSGRAGGMGLHIMDYRARSIGGSLEIQDTGTGTLVCCRVAQRAAALSSEAEAMVG